MNGVRDDAEEAAGRELAAPGPSGLVPGRSKRRRITVRTLEDHNIVADGRITRSPTAALILLDGREVHFSLVAYPARAQDGSGDSRAFSLQCEKAVGAPL
jgi:hypothetical protein